MNNTNAVAPLTYEAFAVLYKSTFAKMMSYSLEQIGSAIYVERLAELADEYPEFAGQQHTWLDTLAVTSPSDRAVRSADSSVSGGSSSGSGGESADDPPLCRSSDGRRGYVRLGFLLALAVLAYLPVVVAVFIGSESKAFRGLGQILEITNGRLCIGGVDTNLDDQHGERKQSDNSHSIDGIDKSRQHRLSILVGTCAFCVLWVVGANDLIRGRDRRGCVLCACAWLSLVAGVTGSVW